MRGITYDRKRVAQMATKYDGYVAKLFDKYIDQLAMYSYAIDPNKAFAFSQVMPKVQVDAIFKEFYSEMYDYMAESASNEWRLSNVKYDKITSGYLKDTELQGSHKLSKLRDTLYDRNQKGLNSFLKRKKYGKTLSNRVWNITNQFKSDTEVAMRDIIRTGLTNGTSASKMASELKKHLKEPNKLYRRVKDKDGKLKWSKQARAYKTGQGVYKSSYKNALRLARTEVNQAFRFADYNRVQSLDFVVGIEIIRSTTPYECDICEELKGRYPKDYIFLGHHPNCYSDDTEVMTNNGWKLFKDLNGEDLIMSLNPSTMDVEYVQQVKYIEADYKGDMIHFNGGDVDLLVTPDHNIVYYTSGGFVKSDVRASLFNGHGEMINNEGVVNWNRKDTIDYNGKVYDVELERNHILYVRRNGKCVWGSNCRCVVKTILADKKEFDSYLKELAQGKDAKFKPSGKITKYPKAYYKYKKIYDKQLKAFKQM